MAEKLRKHVIANFVGYFALFVALGGTAYALGTNTVGSRQIKKNAVKSVDIKNNAVKSVDIANDAVIGADVLDDSLTGFDINESTLGKVGDAETLDGVSSTGFLGSGDKAADSNTLDGIDSSGFLGSSAKAADANSLDGIDSTGFVRSGTLRVIGPVTYTSDQNLLATVGPLQFFGDCLPNNQTRIHIGSLSSYSYASQTHGGGAGDRGSVNTSGAQFLLDATGSPIAQPVTGFVTSGSTQVMFSLYQVRDTNIFGDPFCNFGGYLVVN